MNSRNVSRQPTAEGKVVWLLDARGGQDKSVTVGAQPAQASLSCTRPRADLVAAPPSYWHRASWRSAMPGCEPLLCAAQSRSQTRQTGSVAVRPHRQPGWRKIACLVDGLVDACLCLTLSHHVWKAQINSDTQAPIFGNSLLSLCNECRVDLPQHDHQETAWPLMMPQHDHQNDPTHTCPVRDGLGNVGLGKNAKVMHGRQAMRHTWL